MKYKVSLLTRFDRIFILTSVFIVILFFTGCKKSSQPSHDVIPDEIKQWYLYQKDSYWVYQNDQTPQIDCVYISKDPSLWQENFLKDDGSIYAIKDHLDISYEGNVFQSCNIDSHVVEIGTPESQRNTAFNANILEGHKYIDRNDTFEFVHHYDSLNIDNHYFRDVRQTRYSTIMNNNKTFAVTFFLARHIGLIRINKSISGIDTTWSVIRYHPIQ